MRLLVIYTVILCTISFSTPSAGTVEQVDSSQATGGFSFRGKPLPEASNFFITETGIATRHSLFDRQTVSHITWDFGAMINITERVAAGGTFYASYDDTYDEAFLIGIKARARYWLTRRVHVDVAPGLLITESGTKYAYGGPRHYPTFIGSAQIGYGDWLSLVIQREVINGGEYPARDTYLGIAVGSYIGAIVAPISFALVQFARSIEN